MEWKDEGMEHFFDRVGNSMGWLGLVVEDGFRLDYVVMKARELGMIGFYC